MAKLEAWEIASYAKVNGFAGNQLRIAIAVALAESSGDPSKTGRVGEKGLWQIYPKAWPALDQGGNLYDPNYNAHAAYFISQTQPRRWNYWTTFNTGAYLLFLPKADEGIKRALPVTQDELQAAQKARASSGTVGKLGAGDVAGAITDPLQALTAIPGAFNRIGAWISDPSNIFRIVEVVVGGGLLLVAIAAISRPVVEPVVKTAAAVTPAGRATNAWWGGRSA